MLTRHVALVDNTKKKINLKLMAQTAAALQKQATRDLGPVWGVEATVDCFPDLLSVPLGYWPIVIVDKLRDKSVAGYHEDKNHQPFSLVLNESDWQLTCSHELCEMLVDPWGRELIASNAPDNFKGSSRVLYMLEVCDPCEDTPYAYTINGVMVSDFYTPDYFSPVAGSHTHYSYTGAIKAPRQVLKNGYLSWLDPKDNEWYQLTTNGTGKARTTHLSGMNLLQGSLRHRIDYISRRIKLLTKSGPDKPAAARAYKKEHEKQMADNTTVSKITGNRFAKHLGMLATNDPPPIFDTTNNGGNDPEPTF